MAVHLLTYMHKCLWKVPPDTSAAGCLWGRQWGAEAEALGDLTSSALSLMKLESGEWITQSES